MSVNLEMPTDQNLKQLAPEKNPRDIIRPMGFLSERITANAEEKKVIRHTPSFASTCQITQMVVGALPRE